jgi:toxin ParE1/3/4
LAEVDLIDRTRYYTAEAGVDTASRFFNEAIASLRAAERMPGTGSPRVGELCDIPDLRMRRVTGFPCGWFYFERVDHLDVVRLLADAQNLNAILEVLHDEP